ncbi:hypothetical protein Tco_0382353, partial [Tanacetum coccineum]
FFSGDDDVTEGAESSGGGGDTYNGSETLEAVGHEYTQ